MAAWLQQQPGTGMTFVLTRLQAQASVYMVGQIFTMATTFCPAGVFSCSVGDVVYSFHTAVR